MSGCPPWRFHPEFVVAQEVKQPGRMTKKSSLPLGPYVACRCYLSQHCRNLPWSVGGN